MSTAYSLEPQTEGKVIMHTTKGEIAIELWAKECPKAVRNFVQLAMEGYYDGCLFHRAIKDFMVQTGDPTGTGTGGESIYGKEFMDEIHSRLRFSHRGILAMASNGPNTNGSQFFITLGKCEWLTHKHTIFGRIAGDSIYNALKIAECEADASDRPITSLTYIKNIEILWNPFDDCFPRASKMVQPEIVDVAAERKKKKKQRNLSLLSFGEEQAQDDHQIKQIANDMNVKGKSSHDLLDDQGLSNEVDHNVEKASQKIGDEEEFRKNLLKDKIAQAAKHKANITPGAEQLDFAERMRRQMQERQSRLGIAKDSGNKSEKQLARAAEQRMEEMIEYSDSGSDEEEDGAKKSVLSLKRIRKAKEGENDEFAIKGERSGADRREKRIFKAEVQSRERATLEKLEAFQTELSSKRQTKKPEAAADSAPKLDAASAGKKRKVQQQELKEENKHAWMDAESEEEDEEEDDDWMVHDLTFQRTAADLRKERADMAGLVTLDPRLRKDGSTKPHDSRSQHERRLKPGLRDPGEKQW